MDPVLHQLIYLFSLRTGETLIDESNYGFRNYEVVHDIMKMVCRLTKKTAKRIWLQVNLQNLVCKYGLSLTNKT